MSEILFAVCFVVAMCVFGFLNWWIVFQFDKQREAWGEERAKLLDRIQAGSLTEYKAQERADKPVERKKKDPATERLEKEPWA